MGTKFGKRIIFMLRGDSAMDFLDKATKMLGDGIAVLITKHPLRTSLGALIGVVLIIINHVGGNIFENPQKNPFNGINEWLFIFLGIFFTHIPTLIVIFKNEPEFDESIESAFKAIDRAKNEGMSEYQVNQAYKRLCELVLENTNEHK